jgi:hypothetical protein
MKDSVAAAPTSAAPEEGAPGAAPPAEPSGSGPQGASPNGAAAARVADAARAVVARGEVVANEGARVVASHSVAAAEAALRGVRGSIDEAQKRFDAERADWERLIAGSALPPLGADDPVGHLAARIEREADFWRAFGIRAMRPGTSRAIAAASALVGIVGGLGIATIGALGGLLGLAASAAHLWAAAGALGVGSAVAMTTAVWLDRASARSAREALGRADEAERRLQRAATLLALRRSDETAYREALVRFERS